MTETTKNQKQFSQSAEQLSAWQKDNEKLNQGQEERLAFQKMMLTSQREASPDGVLVVSNARQWLSFNQRFIAMC